MDRRGFFTRAIRKAAQTALDGAEARVNRRAIHWIRPPFARDELGFLLACTRCDKCVEACQPGVIFTLAARLGPDVAGTPALDLLNKGCQLCAGWPCVAVCEPGALRLPQTSPGKPPDPLLDATQGSLLETPPDTPLDAPPDTPLDAPPNASLNAPPDGPSPRWPAPMAEVRISTRHCLPYSGPECGACGSVCPVSGAILWAGPRPSIDQSRCIGCALCREACPVQPKAVTVRGRPLEDS